MSEQEDKLRLRLERMTNYCISLQRAIENHCRGKSADITKALYHSTMLNKRLREFEDMERDLEGYRNGSF
jgi:hypothetical protein